MARSITGVAQHRLKKPTIGLSKIGCEVQAVASPHGESGRNLAVRMSHQRRIWTVSATAVAWIHGGTGRHFANRTSHQPRTWTVPATAVLGFKGGAGRYFTDRTSHQRRIASRRPMLLLFKVRLVILGMASSAKQLQTTGVVAPSFTHRVAVMNVQAAALSATAFTAMAGPGEHLADSGVRNGGSFGLLITCVSRRRASAVLFR